MKAILITIILIFYHPETEKLETPGTFTGKVIAVKDGDTIAILFDHKSLTIRLAHIDCPEVKGGQPYGKEAKKYLSELCFGKMVSVKHHNEFDRYRRLIGVLYGLGGQNLNKEMVKAGYAWHFKKYSKDMTYDLLERDAREKRIGLWKEQSPVPPWMWRR